MLNTQMLFSYADFHSFYQGSSGCNATLGSGLSQAASRLEPSTNVEKNIWKHNFSVMDLQLESFTTPFLYS